MTFENSTRNSILIKTGYLQAKATAVMNVGHRARCVITKDSDNISYPPGPPHTLPKAAPCLGFPLPEDHSLFLPKMGSISHHAPGRPVTGEVRNISVIC